MKEIFATMLLGVFCLTVRAVPAVSENPRERDCGEAEAPPGRKVEPVGWSAYYDGRDRDALSDYRKRNGGCGTRTYPRIPLDPWLPDNFPDGRRYPDSENLRFFIDRDCEKAGTLRGEAEALLGRKVEPSDWIAYYDERDREERSAFRKSGSGMKTRRLVPRDPWLPRSSPRRELHPDFRIEWRREALAALDTFSKAELVGALCREIGENGNDECAELIARLWASVCADMRESGSPEEHRRECERLRSRRGVGEERTAAEARALRAASFYEWRAKAIRDAFGFRGDFDPVHVVVRVMEKYYDDDAPQFCAWLNESRIFETCRRERDPERVLRGLLHQYGTAVRPVAAEALAFFLRGDADSAEALSRADGDADAVTAAERAMSARSRAALAAYRKIRDERFRALSARVPSPVLTESSEKEAFAAVAGWRLPFADCRLGAAGRSRFAYFDVRMKWLAATSLMSVPASVSARASARSEAARERWNAGVRLFGELLAEYQPGLEEKLEAEIGASAESRFNFCRQRALRHYFSRRESGDIFPLFLAGLETFYGNDIDAQLGICSETGVRGKIDLTGLRRPTLSDEAILQYEERLRLKK